MGRMDPAPNHSVIRLADKASGGRRQNFLRRLLTPYITILLFLRSY